jgi:multiple sugar transport system ATP-binding protein
VVLETGERLELPVGRPVDDAAPEKPILLGLRPQHLALAGPVVLPPGVVRVPSKAELIQPTGTRTYVTARIGGAGVTAELGAHDLPEPNAALEFAVDMNRCVLIDPVTDKVI